MAIENNYNKIDDEDNNNDDNLDMNENDSDGNNDGFDVGGVKNDVENGSHMKNIFYMFDPRNWDSLNFDMIKILAKKRKANPKSQLANDSLSDWSHICVRLKQYEMGIEHIINMTAWYNLRERIEKSQTIDKKTNSALDKEKEHWKKVLERIIFVVVYLATHNLAFRGSNGKLYQKSNENFLGLIEMLARFDPIIQEHVHRITNDTIHSHYLGHNIQNELLLLVASAIKSEIIKSVKEAKYFSVILDCTPDVSHQEQMSLILRYVDVSSSCVCIKESFLGFLSVNDTTRQGLFDVLLNELKSLDLDVNDCVIWQIVVVKLKTFFAAKFQIAEVCDALFQVGETDNDNKIRSEAKSLAMNEFGDFEFLVALVIWYEILYRINFVSKQLQSKNMIFDVAIDDIKKLVLFFEDYRESEFNDAVNIAREFAIELNVDPVFRKKRVIRRKKEFDENQNDTSEVVSQTSEESFRVNNFLFVVDQAIDSLRTRFEQYEEFQNVFGFLFCSSKLHTLDNAALKSCCDDL
ncbi:uncharacterized protein LOC141587575 [Silene latifolia]|uniref:uncharacterized protein LOC141587575 n=1 Tax=Silene latifolia TaxID=37657 RepID=UPI003D77D7AC